MTKDSSIISSFLKIRAILPKEHKIKLLFSFFLLFTNSILELAGLAALLPFFSIMLKENFLEESTQLKLVYDFFSFNSVQWFIVFLCCGILVIIILKNIASTIIFRFQSNFAFNLYAYLSRRLYESTYSKGLLYFKSVNSNVVINSIANAPSLFAQFFLLPFLTILNELVVVIMIIVGIILYSPKLVFFLLFTIVPISVLVYLYVRRKLQGVGEKKAEQSIQLATNIRQSIEGYVDVKILNKEAFFLSKYSKTLESSTKLSVNSSVLMTIPTKVIETGMVMAMLTLLFFGLFVMENREQFVTLIGLFAIAGYRILPSINRMMAAILSMKENQYTIDIISDFKAFSPSAAGPTEKKVQVMTFKEVISIENISFAYPGQNSVVDNFTLQVAKGETVGVIGRSGSGKSTLMNILLRFFKEEKGAIKVDGLELNEANEDAWRSLIGYVQQDVYLLDGSILENVAFGKNKHEVDMDKLKDTIEMASLSGFVESLPLGINTPLGERGAKLSGGQRQRIGIARALYANAQILLFDEATSALDNETEAEITESIRKLKEKDLTMIIIAHRYTTLQYCDRIVRMDKGMITKNYTFEELKQDNLQKFRK